MEAKETIMRIIYTSNFIESTSGKNYFSNIPDDLRKFLGTTDGIMEPIVDSLHPNKLYEIEIKIKSIK